MNPFRTCVTGAAAVAVLGLGYAGFGGAAANAAKGADALIASPLKVDDFRLTDQNLHSHELRRLAADKAFVLITQQNGAAANRTDAGALKALQDAYAAKGVTFMMVNSTLGDTRETIAAEAQAYGYNLPILLDRNQLVGEQLGVTRAGEAVVVDPKTWKIAYRGPIGAAGHAWAKDALDALLAGQPVSVASQEPTGALIDFPERRKLADMKISYVREIAPIIQEKCVFCHQSGGIGPMKLTSYEQIKAFSPMIREVVRTQRMPPWRADPTVGHFLNDKSLSPTQTKTLVHWIEAGSPRGEGVDPLGAKTFVAQEWPLGKPDLVLDIPSYNIPASGIVDYQHPFTANPLTEGKWLRASTIKVENRPAVHHVLTGYLASVPKPGQPVYEDSWGASVGDYAVGSESVVQPADIGVYIPAGGAIGFQDHYTPYGKAVTEHSKIAFYFYKDTPKMVMHTSVILNPNISIPPNEESWAQQAYISFPHDALLYAAFPHAHYRGSSSQLWLQTPNGKKTLLLALPSYDFNWQGHYSFAEPIRIPAGSKLIALYTYDNSVRNPANPDHNRTVPWGEQSFDEMLYTQLRYRWVGETSDKQNNYDDALEASRFMGIFDTKMNGKLEPSELTGMMGYQLKVNFAAIDTNHDGFIEQDELEVALKAMRNRSRPAPDKAAASPPAAPSPQKTASR